MKYSPAYFDEQLTSVDKALQRLVSGLRDLLKETVAEEPKKAQHLSLPLIDEE